MQQDPTRSRPVSQQFYEDISARVPGISELGYERFLEVAADPVLGKEFFREVSSLAPGEFEGMTYEDFRAIAAPAVTPPKGPQVSIEGKLKANIAIARRADQENAKKLDAQAQARADQLALERARKQPAAPKPALTPTEAASVFGSFGRTERQAPTPAQAFAVFDETATAKQPPQKTKTIETLAAEGALLLEQQENKLNKQAALADIEQQRQEAGQPQASLFEDLLVLGDQVDEDPNFLLFQAPLESLGEPELGRVYEANMAVFNNTMVPPVERQAAINRATRAFSEQTNIKLAPDQFGRLPEPQVDEQRTSVRYFDPKTGTVRSMSFLKWVTPQKMVLDDGLSFTDTPQNIYRRIQEDSNMRAAELAREQGVAPTGGDYNFYDSIKSYVGSLRRGLTDGVWGIGQGAAVAGSSLWNYVATPRADLQVNPFDNQVMRWFEARKEEDYGTIGENTPVLEDLQNTIASQVFQGVGQAVPALTIGLAMAPVTGASAAGYTSAALGGLSGAGNMAAMGWQDGLAVLAEQRGGIENLTPGDYDRAAQNAYVNFGLGLTESVALLQLGRFFPGGAKTFAQRLFGSGSGRNFLSRFRSAVTNPMTVDGVQEAAQGAGADFAASEILGANRDWSDFSKRASEFGVGFLTSGVLGTGTYFLGSLANVKAQQYRALDAELTARDLAPGTPEAQAVAAELGITPDVALLTEAQARELEDIAATANLNNAEEAALTIEKLESLGLTPETTPPTDATPAQPIEPVVPEEPQTTEEGRIPAETGTGDSLLSETPSPTPEGPAPGGDGTPDVATELPLPEGSEPAQVTPPAPETPPVDDALLGISIDRNGITQLKQRIREQQKLGNTAFLEGVEAQRATVEPVAKFIDALLKDPNALPATLGAAGSALKRRLRLIRDASRVRSENDAAILIDKVESLLQSEEAAGLYDKADALRASLKRALKKPKGRQASKFGESVRAQLAQFRALNPDRITDVAALAEYVRRAEQIRNYTSVKESVPFSELQENAAWALGQIDIQRNQAVARATELFNSLVQRQSDPAVRDTLPFVIKTDEATREQFVESYINGLPKDESLYEVAPQTKEKKDPTAKARTLAAQAQQDLDGLAIQDYGEREAEVVRAMKELDLSKVQDKKTLEAIYLSMRDIADADDFTNAGRIVLQAVANQRVTDLTKAIQQDMQRAKREVPKEMSKEYAATVGVFMTAQQKLSFLSPVPAAVNKLRAEVLAPIEQGQVKAMAKSESVAEGFVRIVKKLPEGQAGKSLKRYKTAALLIQRMDGTPEQQAEQIQLNRERFLKSIELKRLSGDKRIRQDAEFDQEAYDFFVNAGNSADGIRSVLKKNDPVADELLQYAIDAYAKERDAFLGVQEELYGNVPPVILDYTPITFLRTDGPGTIEKIDLENPANMRDSDVDIEEAASGSAIARRQTAKLPEGKVLNTNGADTMGADFYRYVFDAETLEARAIVSRMLSEQYSLDGGETQGSLSRTLGPTQFNMLKAMAIETTDIARRQVANVIDDTNLFDTIGFGVTLSGYDQLIKQAAPVLADAAVKSTMEYGPVDGMFGQQILLGRIAASAAARTWDASVKGFNQFIGASSQDSAPVDGEEFYRALVDGWRRHGASVSRRARIGSNISISTLDPKLMREFDQLGRSFGSLQKATNQTKKALSRYFELGLKLWQGNADKYAAANIWLNKYVNELKRLKPDAGINQANFDPVKHFLKATDPDPETGVPLLTQAEMRRLVSAAEAEVSITSNESNPILQSPLLRAAMGGTPRSQGGLGESTLLRAAKSRIFKSILLFTSHEMSQVTRRYVDLGHFVSAVNRLDGESARLSSASFLGSTASIIAYQAILAYIIPELRDLEEQSAISWVEAWTGKPYLSTEALDEFSKQALREYQADQSQEKFLVMSMAQAALGPASQFAAEIYAPFSKAEDALGKEVPGTFKAGAPLYDKNLSGAIEKASSRVLGASAPTVARILDTGSAIADGIDNGFGSDQAALTALLTLSTTLGSRIGLGTSFYNSVARLGRNRNKVADDISKEPDISKVQFAKEPNLQDALAREIVEDAERLSKMPAAEAEAQIQTISQGLERSFGKDEAERITNKLLYQRGVLVLLRNSPKGGELSKEYAKEYFEAKSDGQKIEALQRHMEKYRKEFGDESISDELYRLYSYAVLTPEMYENYMGDKKNGIDDLREKIEQRMRPLLNRARQLKSEINLSRGNLTDVSPEDALRILSRQAESDQAPTPR